MQAALGLVAMLLGVSHGLESSCDGRQRGAQCYGALGGTLNIRLLGDASEIPRYELYKGAQQILYGRKKTVVTNTIKDRSVFIPSTGTFRVEKLNRNDSGIYNFTFYDGNGKQTASWTLQLFIQAPVSSVELTVDCLPRGNKKASCSSKGGESPRYSWTLDGRSLTDAELLLGDDQTNTVTLRRHVRGKLLCLVSNDVSNGSKAEILTTCGYIFINCTTSNGTEISEWVYEATNTLCVDPTTAPTTSLGKTTTIGSVTPPINITSSNQTVTTSGDDHLYFKKHLLPIIAGVLIALIIFVVVGVAVLCTHKNKQSNKPEEEGDGDLTYADVHIIRRPGRTAEPSTNDSVEYGEVRFSDGPPRAGAAEDDYVYTQVRKAR